ncbi:MAG: prolyl oligopeptidase family serine peptidase [Planctomycetes bacterium]|nr:prolyl oligopeptidase family serine peptidase [Planctomycetota bacterium]
MQTRVPATLALFVATLTALAYVGVASRPALQIRAQDAPAGGAPILLEDCLVLAPVARGVRSFVFTDPIEYEYARGTLKSPAAGDAVTGPEGKELKWEAVRAETPGEVRHGALAGGYLWWKVKSEVAETRVLAAQGHIGVYVNGEPRFGDPYNTGYVKLPVQLRKGDNHFVFRAIRGFVSATLEPVTREAWIGDSDFTLPHLVAGTDGVYWAGIPVCNGTAQTLEVAVAVGEFSVYQHFLVPPLSTRKLPASFHVNTEAGWQKLTPEITLCVVRNGRRQIVDKRSVDLMVRKSHETRNITFLSQIDGSVQYYALRPAQVPAGVTTKPGIVLSLHGASVEASSQAAAYGDKSWCHIVCPTNRRPFGFDWEDWGRLDALEVLEHARATLDHDPAMIYLTGHSMGGHGTWQLGAHYPAMFAAIAPCAGWRSFYTYGGKRDPEVMDDMARLWRRADNPLDTPLLARNHLRHGVFIVHGDADPTVPVTEARAMRDLLKEFHKDLHYYEHPGGTHWYDGGDDNGDTGADCMDYQPIWDLFSRRRVPADHEVREIDFTTMSPGISARCHWAAVWQQTRPLEPSRLQLRADPNMQRVSGVTGNVRLLRLDVNSALRQTTDSQITVVLDGQTLTCGWPRDGVLWLARDEQWGVAGAPAAGAKTPARYGGFKDAFRNRFIVVYGTGGDAETRQWAIAKARMDAEHFYVRGNGSVDVVADTELKNCNHEGRNIILIGTPQTNNAYALLGFAPPLEISPGQVRVGESVLRGDLAVLAVYPRPGSASASIGVISGTSLAGLMLTNRLPYLTSGAGMPDFVVLDVEMLREGAPGLRAAGYFDMDWKFCVSDTVIRK